MRVALSGSGGLIGGALAASLRGDGHEVTPLVRGANWDPMSGRVDDAALAGADAVVHLAGEGIGAKRWSPAQKLRILESRVKGTNAIAETLARLADGDRPRVLVSGSAVGIYGDRGDEELTESSTLGRGFLADLCRAWEAATAPASSAGVRVVHLRTGIVVSRRGGAFGRLTPLFRLGLGGRLGSGRQWWSWITLDDEVGIIRHAIDHASVSGPINASAPNPVTNAGLSKALGRVLRRPAVLPVPAFALGLVMGKEMAAEVITASQRMRPARVLETGYAFRHTEVEEGLRSVFARG